MTTAWRVMQGDCLDVLPTLEAGSFDLVLVDPPYGINTKSDGTGKLNPWADLCNAALWYATWMKACRRVLRSNGSMWTCLNWRSLPTFQKAACDIGWPIESLLVWDKQWIGPGGQRGLRPSYELVALFAMPDFSLEDRGLPDVQRFQWSPQKPTGHPAEKPVSLLAWVIAQTKAARVLDCFCGSGSTGVAAAQAGAEFVGIEIDGYWADRARERITSDGSPLFAKEGAA